MVELSRSKEMTEKFYSENPDILGGTTVFAGTRVPVTALFDYLAAGDTVSQFHDDFPSVQLEQIQTCLQSASVNFKGDDEAAP